MTSDPPRSFDLKSRVQRSSQQVHCQVGDRVVLMAVSGGDYFELNRVGSRIWQELVSPMSIDAVVDRLLPEFEVDRPTCEAQVLAWVGKMQGLGFIDVVEA